MNSTCEPNEVVELLYPRELLLTFEGVSEAMRRTKHEKHLVNTHLQQVRRSRADRHLSTDERDRVAALEARIDSLQLHLDELRGIRIQFDSDDRLRVERMFLWAAAHVLDKATYDAIMQKARDTVEAQQRLASRLSVGAAIPMRGAVGGMKRREP